FVVNGRYSGGTFLFYDGHPGFDYRTTDQDPVVSQAPTNGRIPVLAAADGTLDWNQNPTGSCPNGGGSFGTMQVTSSKNNLVTRYLHLDCRSFSTDFFRTVFG